MGARERRTLGSRWGRWAARSGSLVLICALAAGCAGRSPVPAPSAAGSGGTPAPSAQTPASPTPTSALAAAIATPTGTLTLTEGPGAPAGTAPAAPTAPIFLNAQVGFVAGLSTPVWDFAGLAGVYRTADAGQTWTQVWQSPTAGLFLSSMGASPGGHLLFAAGSTGVNSQVPELVVSTDGGSQWQTIQPGLPSRPTTPAGAEAPGGPTPLADAIWLSLRFQFVSATVGFAGFNPMDASPTAEDEAPLVLVTHDGGRHWSALPLPPGMTVFSGGLDFLNAEDGWVTGRASAGCNRLWETRDAGLQWAAATGCLPFALRAVDFVSATQGFAGGGTRGLANGPHDAVLATVDGGRQWTTVYAPGPGGRPIVQLTFTSPEDGLAVTGTVPRGAQRIGSEILRTTDGGRSWTPVAGGSSGGLSLAPGAVWAGDPRANALLESTDGGATWTSRSAYAAVSGVRLLRGSPLDGWIRYGAQFLATTDGGRTWAPYPAPPGGALPAFASVQTAFARTAAGGLMETVDGGLHWSAAALPAGVQAVQSVTFSNAADGWLAWGGSAPAHLLATTDGGRTWQAAGTLPVWDGHLAFGSRLWVATGLRGAGAAVAVSADQGATWTVSALPAGTSCASPQVAGVTVWLVCAQTQGGPTAQSLLVRSGDGGLHWTALAAPMSVYALSIGGAQGWLAAGAAGGGSGQAHLYGISGGGNAWTLVFPDAPALPLPNSGAG